MFYEIKEYFCTIKVDKHENKSNTKLSFVHISTMWFT